MSPRLVFLARSALFAGPGRDSPVLRQQRVAGGLVGMVEVGFALPRVDDRAVVHIQFVPPGTVCMVNDVFLGVGPEPAVGILVALLSRGSEQARGCSYAFCDLPEEALGNHWRSIPVDGIAESAVAGPGVAEGPVEKVSCGIKQPGFPNAEPADLEQQLCPLQPVARLGAVGTEGMPGLVVVVFREFPPAGVEMLWEPPGPILSRGGSVGDTVCDPQSTFE